MTAQQEAQILIGLFTPHASGLSVVSNDEVVYSQKSVLESAKKCAAIFVDEMIRRLNDICFNHGINDGNQLQDEYDWLRKIKQEIESL